MILSCNSSLAPRQQGNEILQSLSTNNEVQYRTLALRLPSKLHQPLLPHSTSDPAPQPSGVKMDPNHSTRSSIEAPRPGHRQASQIVARMSNVLIRATLVKLLSTGQSVLDIIQIDGRDIRPDAREEVRNLLLSKMEVASMADIHLIDKHGQSHPETRHTRSGTHHPVQLCVESRGREGRHQRDADPVERIIKPRKEQERRPRRPACHRLWRH